MNKEEAINGINHSFKLKVVELTDCRLNEKFNNDICSMRYLFPNTENMIESN